MDRFGWQGDGLIGSLVIRRLPAPWHAGGAARLLLARLAAAASAPSCASLRERSIGADPDRRLAWLLALATVPAALIGFVGEDMIDEVLHGGLGRRSGWRSPASWWSARWPCGWPTGSGPAGVRWTVSSPAAALTIGLQPRRLPCCPASAARARPSPPAWRSGLTRESAARFSFLLATPITLGAGLYGSRNLLDGGAHGDRVAGHRRRLRGGGHLRGMLAIGFLLAWLRQPVGGGLQPLPARVRGARRGSGASPAAESALCDWEATFRKRACSELRDETGSSVTQANAAFTDS